MVIPSLHPLFFQVGSRRKPQQGFMTAPADNRLYAAGYAGEEDAGMDIPDSASRMTLSTTSNDPSRGSNETASASVKLAPRNKTNVKVR